MDIASPLPPFTLNKRHPKQLFYVSFASMWVWFSYYGVKALLIAYMVTQMHLQEKYSYAVLGTYAALVYGLQIFGGVLADRLLGFRKSMIWGGILMICGHALMSLPYPQVFFAGLSFIAWGSGFFSGPDAAIIGMFYPQKDQTQKDNGFILFYMIINTGMALGGLVCGYVGQKINWHYGFGLAGIFMVLGLINFCYGIPSSVGAPPDKQRLQKKVLFVFTPEIIVYVLSVVAVLLTLFLFSHTGIMDVLVLPLTLLSFVYVIYIGFHSSNEVKYKLFALLFVFVMYACWLALYEQSTGALNLFILRNVDVHIGNFTVPALAFNNFFPSFLLVMLTPLALATWKHFAKRNKEVHTFTKLIIGIVAMGVYFSILWLVCHQYKTSGLVPVAFMALGYVFMEIGEVCIGPTMPAATFNLSPIHLVGTIMSIGALSGALAEYIAAKIGALMTVPSGITNPAQTITYYSTIFGKLALLSALVAAGCTLLFPVLKKWMGDVR